MNKYLLEIYSPGSAYDVTTTIESNNPFLSIGRGDLINPSFFENNNNKGIFRVVNIEHIIWKSENIIKHKACVFTELVDDTAEIRTKK